LRSIRRLSIALALVASCAWLVPAALAATHQVLRVGSFQGIPGQYASIQQAVDAAKPGDWVLVGPGDHKTTTTPAPAGRASEPAGVLIQTAYLYLRGMNRNTVVVDGTKPGSPKCSSAAADQNFGPSGSGGAQGLNGIEVFKAPDVWVQNLTACNFLGGSGTAGNEIWWNGGDTSTKVGGYGYYGSYLTATSTYYADEHTAAQYGIFSSNWSGGTWDQTYASNFNDSGYYIGACQQVCDQVVNHAHGEWNDLGYSGSNSGGSLVVKNSEFNDNQDGFDTNSQNGDNPPPQNGACPGNGTSPITHTHSCWVFMNNFVHDNNFANAPRAGLAGNGPLGTGMSVSGGRNDTIMNNVFENNNAWGVIFVPFPDFSASPCTGGVPNELGPGTCFYDEWGDALLNNKFKSNGSFGNTSNGDFAQLNLNGGNPTDCSSGNTEIGGGSFTSSPSTLPPTCDGTPAAANLNLTFFNEVACDSGALGTPCLPTSHYPKLGSVIMHPLPPVAKTPTMPNPCAGVPADPWCSGTVTRVAGCSAATVTIPLSLSANEALKSLTVTVSRRGSKVTRLGKAVKVFLGAASGTVRVTVAERLKVGSHTEKVVFTRVYHRC
jgi:hypothetical protein